MSEGGSEAGSEGGVRELEKWGADRNKLGATNTPKHFPHVYHRPV
jgi:hypothetical protein